jgi:hypothetical protein
MRPLYFLLVNVINFPKSDVGIIPSDTEQSFKCFRSVENFVSGNRSLI